MHTHRYAGRLTWTGARHGATTSYNSYSREYEFRSADKPPITCSADPHFRGDPALYNPEELLVLSLSRCHLLSYLAECARAGIAVVSYEDDATGTMTIKDRRMRFTEVTLHPRVVIAQANAANVDRAVALHHEAHDQCFIANSVNFEVRNEPVVTVAG